MTTIVSELEQLKRRVMPGVKHEISSMDQARYLETIVNLCKYADSAAMELASENEVLRNLVVSASAKPMGSANTADLSKPSSGGLKIGSTPHTRSQSLDGHMKRTATTHLTEPTLPSVTNSLNISASDYSRNAAQHTGARIEQQDMAGATRGAWWHRQQPE